MKEQEKSNVQAGLDHNYDASSQQALTLHQKNQENQQVQPEQFYKDLLGENVYEFYFGKDQSEDIRDLMADCVSQKKWDSFIEKHKAGEISSEDLRDMIMISHLHAIEGANPVSSAEEIMDRAVESKVRGKLGRKLIASTISTLSNANLLTAPKEAVTALLSHTLAKSDTRAETAEEVKLLPTIAENPLKDVADESYAEFLNSMNVADLVRDITVEELLARLENEEDPYFGITHQITFDLGWESVSRKSTEKCLALYVCELDKAWTDSLESNVKQSDRHISRYLVRDVKKGEIEKIHAIRDALVKKYASRLNEKIDFFEYIWKRG